MKRLREQFRGLYWRQMSITVGMVLLTLVLLGTVFFSLSYNYARGQKTDELLERAQVVSRLSVRYLESGRYLTMEELRQDQVFQQLAATAAMISDMDILVCDEEGHVLLSTDEAIEATYGHQKGGYVDGVDTFPAKDDHGYEWWTNQGKLVLEDPEYCSSVAFTVGSWIELLTKYSAG